jgi:hypothetical protein
LPFGGLSRPFIASVALSSTLSINHTPKISSIKQEIAWESVGGETCSVSL